MQPADPAEVYDSLIKRVAWCSRYTGALLDEILSVDLEFLRDWSAEVHAIVMKESGR